MNSKSIDRRTVLGHSLALAAAVGFARAALSDASAGGMAPAANGDAAATTAPPFGDAVKSEAQRLSLSPYNKAVFQLPEPFDKLSYDQYRDIRFRPEMAIWKNDKLGFELQPFPMGWLYDTPIDLSVVQDGVATRLVADGRLFAIGPLIGNGPQEAPFGFSGFRIHGPINRADYFDEFAVFQGASYLRAVGRGQGYGASARGLALNTGRPGGEEFPYFRSFWIERPKAGDVSVVVHALLDSPSTTGAYRFDIQPGETTVMDVEATLYPRKPLTYAGIAPLTSMFFHGPANLRQPADYRPEVHDSEGLAIWTGSGERIWRPLLNAKTLQTSAFVDKNPKGFGLSQRDRDFGTYQDLEAHYERRPTVWVEPKGDWGEGFVELLEIPVQDEIHDNIVCYWKPAKELAPGTIHTFNYKLHWAQRVPVAWSGAYVGKTRIGAAKKPDTLLFVIDYEGASLKDIRDLPVAEVSGNAGAITNVVVQRNTELGGLRVTFELAPQSADIIELRLVLKASEQIMSETWLYRWVKP